MMRDILTLLNKGGAWACLPPSEVQRLVVGIVGLACEGYDCNAGEILEGHEAFGICYGCRQPAASMREGLCSTCVPDDEWNDEE